MASVAKNVSSHSRKSSKSSKSSPSTDGDSKTKLRESSKERKKKETVKSPITPATANRIVKTRESIQKAKTNEVQKSESKTVKSVPKTNPKVESSRPKIIKSTTRTKTVLESPSSRVTRTQFFPSKNMYSNALLNKSPISQPKTLEVKRADPAKVTKKVSKIENTETHKPDRARNKTRTLSPSEVKVIKTQEEDPSSSKDRPRTATLHRPSIIHLIDDPQQSQINASAANNDEDDYEDDFDSYESDFEEYASSESTLHDVNLLSDGDTTSSESSLTKPTRPTNSVGDERKLDSGNFDMSESQKKIVEPRNDRSNMTSLSDEGFEDSKSLHFVNFLEAKKKFERSKSLKRRHKRGEEILSMIRLDTYSFTVFDIPPVPYDIFIRNYGMSNRIQTASQTGDDNVSEEIQTDVIEYSNKSTQFPVAYSKNDLDMPQVCEYNEKRLKTFMDCTGELILGLLDEDDMSEMAKNLLSTHLPISSGYIKFATFLENRPISFVTCYESKLLTVHNKSNSNDEIGFCSVLCIWKIACSDEPENILMSYGDICDCCFLLDHTNIILAGLNDGSVTLWNIKEEGTLQQVFIKELDKKISLRSPTFVSEIATSHASKIISILPITEPIENSPPSFTIDWSPSLKVCTLDEDGCLIIWSVHESDNTTFVPKHHSLAHWGKLSLIQSSKFCLKEIYPDLPDFQCTDMSLNLASPNHLYISTNYGFIIHCLSSGTKTNPQRYISGNHINCLEMCHFSPLYFLAGCDNGNVDLYSRNNKKPLISISDKESSGGIKFLQWSCNNPFFIYSVDSNNVMHVWDFTMSDLHPSYSIPFKEKINYMKLSSAGGDEKIKSYMIIATENGSLYLYVLNDKYGQQNSQIYKAEVEKFLKYLNRL